ncbi:MATE family efflux transporter [Clostridium sp. Cult2]|nr:MATE family efflux transporter [Clostridium sp. Cult2]
MYRRFFYGVNDKLFAEGKVGKVLLKFSIPAIISLLVAELYNMVDTIFVGRVIGGNGIGALVVVFPIQRIVAAISMMLAIGSSTSVARKNGEKNKKAIINVIKNGITLAFVIIIPLMVFTYLFRDNILTMLGASENILPYAHDYLSIIIFGSLFICLTTVMNYIMMSLGNRKVTLISTTLGATLNIIIDYILVVGLSYGVKGAAIATVVSQFIAFLYSACKFKKIKDTFNLSLGFQLKKEIGLGIIGVGFSAFIVEAEDGILLAILNNLLLNHVGDTGVIILGVISKVSMFMFITMLGISSAMQPIAAYNLGAKSYKRLKKVVKETMIFALITSTVLWLIAITFSKAIISLFVKEPYLVVESAKAFRVMVTVFPLLSIYYVTIYYYQSLGRAKTSFLVSIFRQIIVMLPVSLILVKILDLGALGVWLSYPIADLISSVSSIFLMKKAFGNLDVKVEENKQKRLKKQLHYETM